MVCKLGNHRPEICKKYPQRSKDITSFKKIINEVSTCTAKVGGKGCSNCGQCCRDKPFPSKDEVPEGIPETKGEDWQNPITKACIHLEKVM